MNINLHIDLVSALAGALLALLFVYFSRRSTTPAAAVTPPSESSLPLYLIRTKTAYYFAEEVPAQCDPFLVNAGCFVFTQRADAYNFSGTPVSKNVREIITKTAKEGIIL